MEPQLTYVQHTGKAVKDSRFSHMMALSLNSASGYRQGVIRCITSRQGNIKVAGYIDRSQLYGVYGETLENFNVEEPIKLQDWEEIVSSLAGKDTDFIGLEDPDIFIDEAGITHLYFTMPFIRKDKKHSYIHLGHATGKDLTSLRMTFPVLRSDSKNTAKEVSIAPKNSHGVRLNLFESSDKKSGEWYSTVRIGIAKNMEDPWEFGKTVFHPKEQGIPWIGGHASPGPLLPRSFYDAGPNKLLGFINGRETNRRVGKEVHYGTFSVGLFIYDYEHGKIDWVSSKPFIQDSEAKTITFASQFVETGNHKGILYAHVDDSFVRAYTIQVP